MTAAPPLPPHEARAAWLAFAGCSAIWGSTFLFISIGNDTLAPVWAAALRLGIAAVVLTVVTRLTGQSLPRGPALKAALQYGALQFGCNMPLLYWGEKTVPSGLAAVLFATIPLSVALIARFFGMERLNPLKLIGAVIAILGVAVIGGGLGDGAAHLPGVVAVLAATVVSALGTTLLKRGPRQSAFGANAVGCMIGFAICVPISYVMHEVWALPRTPSGIIALAYLVLAGSTGAFALLAWLIHRWPVSRVAFISVVTPLVATFLGVMFRHEKVTAASLLGTVLVLIGLFCGLAADRISARQSSQTAH